MKNLKRLRLLVVFFFAACTMVACDDDDDKAPANNNVTPKMTAAEFMMQAAGSDTFEISSGMMARTRGTDAGVKTFADTLVKDHTMTSTELKAIARQKNVTLPKTMPADKQALLNDLTNRARNDFDKRFSDIQIQAHTEAIALFQRAINEVEDTQVRDFANRHLPHLQMHLRRANQLKARLQ